MACCVPANPQEVKSQEIDKVLKKDKTQRLDEVRILLLGAGESGKSTVFKQMKIIQDNGGYSKEELQFYIQIVRSNLMSQMRVLVEVSGQMGIEIEEKEAKESFLQSDNWHEQTGPILKRLWSDKGIQAVYQRKSEYQLNDSCAYFFEKVDTIMQKDYLPTQQDVLHSRVRTTGIEEATFCFGFEFKMIDVGGQRTERRKWIHFFENILSCIIFCASLSEYDQKLREDRFQNRMHESLQLFHEVANCPYFRTTPIILFLNKIDLFREKLKQNIDLKVAFPDYNDGCDETKALNFIREKYLKQNLQPKEIYTHVTCAVDTQAMIPVFKAVSAILTKDTLSETGMSI